MACKVCSARDAKLNPSQVFFSYLSSEICMALVKYGLELQ